MLPGYMVLIIPPSTGHPHQNPRPTLVEWIKSVRQASILVSSNLATSPGLLSLPLSPSSNIAPCLSCLGLLDHPVLPSTMKNMMRRRRPPLSPPGPHCRTPNPTLTSFAGEEPKPSAKTLPLACSLLEHSRWRSPPSQMTLAQVQTPTETPPVPLSRRRLVAGSTSASTRSSSNASRSTLIPSLRSKAARRP
jgi:hypothetical protein